MAEIERAEIKDQLRQNTDRAVERGVFGAPTFFVGTPNGWKITIMLEECGLPYTIKDS